MNCLRCRGMIGLGLVSAALITATLLASNVGGPFTPAGPLGGLWIGGAGQWSSPSNWDQTPSPQLLAGLFATIDGGSPAASVANMDVNVTLRALGIDADDRVHIQDGHWLMMTTDGSAPVIDCAGQLVLEGASQLLLDPGSALVLNGGGVLRLSGAEHALIAGTSGAEMLFNVENTIAGSGALGNNSLSIVNSGTLDADAKEMELVIDPGVSGVINNGIMQASGGGRLYLTGGTFVNNGTIRANDWSRVEFEGATVIGGTLEANGNGFFRTLSVPSSLQDVTLSAPFELGLTQLTLIRQLRNDGRIEVIAGTTLNDSGIAEILVPPGTGDLTLDGDGELNMQLCKVHSGSAQSAGRLINGEDHTIHGDGILGANTVGLVNHGTIHADRYSPIVIDPPNAQTLENTGSIIASGFGGVAISGATFHNSGTLEVRDASRIALTASVTLVNNTSGTLTGGVWRVIADGHPTTLALWNGVIFQNDADILLSGVGSFFNAINGLGGNYGRFALRNGRKFTTTSSFFSNSGSLDVGAGCLFTVNGPFIQDAAGRLIVEIDGAPGNGVTVNGAATVGGVLEVRLVGDAEHLVGESIEVLRANSLGGSFSEVITPWGVQAQINGGSLSIAITEVCEGDTNGDGFVDIDDLLEVVQTWDTGCPPAPEPCVADLNSDNAVDINDLLEIVNGWGSCH